MAKQQSKRQQSKRRKHRGGNARDVIENSIKINMVKELINQLNPQSTNFSARTDLIDGINKDTSKYLVKNVNNCENSNYLTEYVENLMTIIKSDDEIISPHTKLLLIDFVNKLDNCRKVDESVTMEIREKNNKVHVSNATMNPAGDAMGNPSVGATTNPARFAMGATMGGAAKRRKSRRTHKRK